MGPFNCLEAYHTISLIKQIAIAQALPAYADHPSEGSGLNIIGEVNIGLPLIIYILMIIYILTGFK